MTFRHEHQITLRCHDAGPFRSKITNACFCKGVKLAGEPGAGISKQIVNMIHAILY